MIYTRAERQVLQCKNLQTKLISPGNVVRRKEHVYYSYNHHSYVFPMNWCLKKQRMTSKPYFVYFPPSPFWGDIIMDISHEAKSNHIELSLSFPSTI